MSVTDYLEVGLAAFPSAIQAVKESIGKPGSSPDRVLRELHQNASIPRQAIERFVLLKSLLDFVPGQSEIAEAIASDESVQTFAQVAAKYYDVSSLRNVSEPALRSFQTRLLSAEPAAIINKKLQDGKLRFAATVHDLVKSTLAAFVADQKSFQTSSLAEFVKTRAGSLEVLDDEEEQAAFLDTLKAIQRLSMLVDNPLDLPRLIEAKFTSASAIATTLESRFSEIAKKAGIAPSSAKIIQQRAIEIDYRNEGAWLALMRAKKPDYDLTPLPARKGPARKPTFKQLYNMTDMFSLETQQCEDCCSITGMAAYFADLMKFMDDCNVEDGKLSLYQKLKARRPDLENLQLSCANSKTLVSYIDLANEVMEAYVMHLAGLKSQKRDPRTVAFDSPDTDSGKGDADDTSAGEEPRQRNTNLDVYRNQISWQMYPFSVFPYNHALESFKLLLSADGASREQFLHLFGSAARVLHNVKTRLPPANEAEYTGRVLAVEIALARLSAAETLGLSHEDFYAITGGSFWVEDTASIFFGAGSHAYPRAAQLWGYSGATADDAKNTMLDQTSGDGLTFVTDQFLPRSGLEFADLVLLLKTRFARHRLVLCYKDGSDEFTHRLADMRLRSSLVARQPGPLDPAVCYELQAFIRLSHKLKWPIPYLDQVVESLRQNLQQNGVPQSGIGAPLLVEMSAARRLSTLVGQDLLSLLPLWSAIDTYDSQSLYHKLFLNRRIKSGYPDFASKAEGYLASAGRMVDHLQALSAAFGAVKDSMSILMDAAGVDLYDTIDLGTVSKIYRLLVLCEMLQIRRSDCMLFLRLFSDFDVFHSPSKTLAAVSEYRTLVEGGWTLQHMDELTGGDHRRAHNKATVSLSRKIAKLIMDNSAAASQVAAAAPVSDEIKSTEVNSLASELFPPAVATTVADFVEAKLVTTLKVSIKVAPSSGDLEALPAQLSVETYKPKSTDIKLVLKGTLTANQKTQVKKLKATSKQWADSIDQLDSDSKQILAVIKLKFDQSSTSQATAPVFTALEGAGQPESQAVSGQDLDREVSLQKWVTSRKDEFIALARPQVTELTMRQRLVEELKALFPGIDPNILDTMLSRVTSTVGTGGNAELTVADMLRQLLSTSAEQENIARTMFFTSDSAETCKLSLADPDTLNAFSDSGETPRISVNGVQEDMIPAADGASYDTTFTVKPGDLNLFIANFDIDDLVVLDQSSPSALFPPTTYLAGDNSPLILSIATSITTIVSLVEISKLTSQELDQLPLVLSPKKLDWNNLTMKDIRVLRKYTKVKESVPEGQENILITLLGSLKSAESKDSLTGKLASLLSVSAAVMKRVIDGRWPKVSDRDLRSKLQDLGELEALQGIIAFITRHKLQTDSQSLQMLFGLAEPRPLFSFDYEFDNIPKFRASIQGSIGKSALMQYQGSLQLLQRDALSTYLLQQNFIRKQDIWDANGLFEYLLIDVQMGQQLQTSRIKQAISTIQLYVQRCLLGLEVERGIKPEDIDRTKWGWMQRFAIWEALRKTVLYPENWIDPTLRDDKSPQFLTFESAIMQQDLSLQTFEKALSEYIRNLRDISDLEVEAYVRGFDKKKDQDCFHIVARTKSSPYRFFYRRMDVIHPQNDVFWSPWSLLDVEIPIYEADWNGDTLKRNGAYILPVISGQRLILLFPQFIVKTLPKKKPPPSSAQAQEGAKKATYNTMKGRKMLEDTPVKFWEIRLAWSELVDSKWTQRKVSSTALTVYGRPDRPLTSELPSVANFHFNIDKRSGVQGEIVTIAVGCWYSSSEYTDVGSFQLREDRVAAVQASPATVVRATTVMTTFSKLSYTFEAAKGMLDPNTGPSKGRFGSRTLSPILAIPEAIVKPKIVQKADPPKVEEDTDTEEEDTEDETDEDTEDEEEKLTPATNGVLTYTMSYNINEALDEQKLCGMIFDVEVPDRRGNTMFGYRRDGLGSGITSANLGTKSQFVDMKNPSESVLVRALSKKSVSKTVFREVSKFPRDRFGYLNRGAAHELSTPHALYNWELAVHGVMLAMERLLATQQFELAIQVARLVFDPTISGTSSADCWRFPPFRKIASDPAESTEDILDNLRSVKSYMGHGVGPGTTEKMANPSAAHVAARERPVAYMKRIMMKYIEILIASGDDYFRQGSLEAVPLALQRYIEASHVLGRKPQDVPTLGQRRVKTYATLLKDVVDMELLFPFGMNLARRQADGSTPPRAEGVSEGGLKCFMRTSYFCIPTNPRFQALRDLLNDRLYKLRNSLDIAGKAKIYSLTELSIDPGALAFGLQGAMSAMKMVEADSPMPNYRFAYLVGKTIEMCTELKGLGEQLLSAKEKKDGEVLSVLRARQDTAVQTFTMGIKKLQKEEAEKTLESLRQSRETTAAKLSFYLQLIGESTDKIPGPEDDWQDLEQTIEEVTSDDLRMTMNEKMEMDLAEEASLINAKATGLELEASVLTLLPNLTENIEPMGMGVSMKIDAGNVAQSLSFVAGVMRAAAGAKQEIGSRALRKVGLVRQLQERRMQANTAGRELKAVDQQIDIQLKRIETIDKETELQQLQRSNAAEVEQYYRSKFTNEALYNWMENTLRLTYFEAYNMAVSFVKKAERVFQFEQGTVRQESALRREGGWDSSREGLLAGQNLLLSVKKLELDYLEHRFHDFEITKNISLRAIDPTALIMLRETGTASFRLSEMLFDFDFPGHYMRRIKSVSISIPCITGPYTSINATLTLVNHTYRVNATSSSGTDYVNVDGDNSPFRTDRVPISSVALSSAMQDSGTFELAFQGERFLPFEGAGVISEWRLDLPTVVKQFDYATISDVVMHVKYTSLYGGLMLRKAANEAVGGFIKDVASMGEAGRLQHLVDLKNDYASDWQHFQQQLRQVGPDKTAEITISNLHQRLPFWTRGRNIRATSVKLIIVPKAEASWTEKVTVSHCSDPKNWKVDKSHKAGTIMVYDGINELFSDPWTIAVGKPAEKATVDRILLLLTYAFE